MTTIDCASELEVKWNQVNIPVIRCRSEKMCHRKRFCKISTRPKLQNIPDNFKWKVFSEILISKINDSQYK
ncbi:hypothetical protein T01_4598 [Trichinella spiralis]|uniref:Uncharacterized protein n=1 Tax=Trichinella spiralis TaxID=6334 RepID=A0A0V1BV01_TRISP|nr:hypothetical protein T01_4598 [Trichinella spiralis]